MCPVLSPGGETGKETAPVVRWGWREMGAYSGLEVARIGGRQTGPLCAAFSLFSLVAFFSLLRWVVKHPFRRKKRFAVQLGTKKQR